MRKKLHYLSYKIKKEEEQQEILSLLYQSLRLTTRKIRSLKREPLGILLDGKPAAVRENVCAGQLLQIMLNDSSVSENDGQWKGFLQKAKKRTDTKGISELNEAPGKIIPADIPLEILYEDEDLLFINKPSGMVCHPSKGHWMDSLANGVKNYFIQTDQIAGVHFIGRLDKDTSGIVGVAKNKVTAERMIRQKLTGEGRKEYLALVKGKLPEKSGCIHIPMEEKREKEGYLKMEKGSGAAAKKAITHYTVLKVFETYSLCLVQIETGRTHQIRFHMAQIGCPLLGDGLYGDKQKYFGEEKMLQKQINEENKGEANQSRAALHAYRVWFRHPYTGEKIIIRADMPEDMKKQCRQRDMQRKENF